LWPAPLFCAYETWQVFNPPGNGYQLTTIDHESTTTAPQKHHQKNAHFQNHLQKLPQKAKKAPATAGTCSYQIEKIKR
jgi:uncharacterized protein YfcZ (UPF0381/DUF406 family)